VIGHLGAGNKALWKGEDMMEVKAETPVVLFGTFGKPTVP